MQALEAFLNAAGGTAARSERQRVAAGLTPYSHQAFVDLQAMQGHLCVSSRSLEHQLSVIAVLQTLWAIIPSKLFTSCDPNYRALVEQSLEAAGFELSAQAQKHLVVVFKRLRRHYDFGREATSLDLSSTVHVRLFDSQSRRCAICRYRFAPSDIDMYEEADFHLSQPHVPLRSDELVLDTIMRNPVLDHILPVFLGGDGEQNWQILCGSCNAGKGDCWSAIARAGLLPPTRVREALHLKPSLRYAVLATTPRSEGASDEFAIVKRARSGLVVYSNLCAIPSGGGRS